MKNKIRLLIALPVVLSINALAQSAVNRVITESRTSAPYHHIQIKGEMKVKLLQDKMPGVTVEGTNYQTGNTVTMLRNDTLFIYQTNIRRTDAKTIIKINVDDLASLEVTGRTTVNSNGLVNTDYLIIRAYAGAQIKLDVRAMEVDSRATGCGVIDVTGSTVNFSESIDECSIIDSHSLDVLDKQVPDYRLCYGC